MKYEILDQETLELFEVPEWEKAGDATERELANTLGIKTEDLSELERQMTLEYSPNVEDLKHYLSMTEAKARVFAAAIELMRRQKVVSGRRISYPTDSVKFFNFLVYREQEHFVVMTLNGAHDVIDVKIVTSGLLNRTVVHPREVFRPAIADNAAAVIVCHNHPSGNQNPSQDDRDVTTRLVHAGNNVGIKVLDHIIVAKNGYYSFLEHNDI